MPNNRKGICLPLKNCPNLNKLASKSHLTMADRKFLRRSRCGHIGRTPLVCCMKQRQQLHQQQENLAARISGSPLQLSDLPSDCGRTEDVFNRDLYIVEYIVGGDESRLGDSPWLVLLSYLKGRHQGINLYNQSLCLS